MLTLLYLIIVGFSTLYIHLSLKHTLNKQKFRYANVTTTVVTTLLILIGAFVYMVIL